MQYINPSEVIKRLAAAQGIDVLNLVKTEEQLAQEQQRAQQDQIGQSLVDQPDRSHEPLWLNKHGHEPTTRNTPY